MQTCSKCLVEKSLLEFNKRKDSKTGYRKDCKECFNIVKNKYYLNNKEHINKKMRDYYESHKEEMNISHREYWKEYYADNKDKVLEYQQNYRENNKEKCLERVSKWSSTDKGKLSRIIRSGKRRGFKKSTADNTINIHNTVSLLEEQNYLCKYCKCDLNLNKKHLDHIIPLSKGGCHSITNVQWLCQKCNLIKSNKIILNTKT